MRASHEESIDFNPFKSRASVKTGAETPHTGSPSVKSIRKLKKKTKL